MSMRTPLAIILVAFATGCHCGSQSTTPTTVSAIDRELPLPSFEKMRALPLCSEADSSLRIPPFFYIDEGVECSTGKHGWIFDCSYADCVDYDVYDGRQLSHPFCPPDTDATSEGYGAFHVCYQE